MNGRYRRTDGRRLQRSVGRKTGEKGRGQQGGVGLIHIVIISQVL